MDEKLNKRYTSAELAKFMTSTKLLMWDSAPNWASGIIEYKDGKRYWISIDGSQLKKVTIKNPEDIDIVKWFQYLADAELLDLLGSAWGLITNAYNGEWDMPSPDWVKAVYLWRDSYARVLKKASSDEVRAVGRQQGD